MSEKSTNVGRSARSALAGLALAAFAAPVAAQETVIEVSATQPEYFAQDRAIWDLYEEENPGVKIELFSINEDTEAAFQARVAAGDPPDIRGLTFPTRDNYKTYVNLLDIDFPNWDKANYDARTIFEQTHGVEGYAPAFNVQGGLFLNLIYYADEMEKAGLDPKSIGSVDDLRALLEELKAHVDTRDDVNYVLDIGWHPRFWGRWLLEAWGVGMGATKEDFRRLWTGEIAWTDQENNPMVPALELAKEFTEKGYFPENWWTRAWEQEYEASFITGKSIMAVHGPWLWNKVLAQNPDAELDGIFFPPNENGVVWQDATTADRGSALFAGNMDDPNFEAAKKAFYWWTSPEIVKLRAEAIGYLPAMDLTDQGGVELQNPQYVKLVGPALDAGEITFDNSLGGQAAAGPMQKSGTPFVVEDNAMASEIGAYVSGETSLEELLELMQARWDQSYGQ
ncbi:carbohydrate ABC transporter substrate-binding protein [Rhodobacteraceae bacterium CCMM004]|nr:carbohydrate ABC transporter substrate-binding protein [Rhodobacteraceae bacterium CCMM004]